MDPKKLEDMRARKAEIQLGGGEKAITKQHDAGKLTARERLEKLFDEGTFVELNTFMEHRCTNFGMETKKAPGEGVVTGYGRVNGRVVYAFSQDATVLGGSLGEMHGIKITKVQDLAMKAKAPLVGINDSGGARVQEGVDALFGYGEIFYRNVMASGVVPQISVILGPSAGGAVYSPALTDFICMVDKVSQMFITGPEVLKTVIGEEVTKEELGGAYTHNSVSGVAQFYDSTEDACFERVRKLLGLLPQSAEEKPPVIECTDDVNRLIPEFDTILPEHDNLPYDVIEIIEKVADNGEFMEYQPMYAPNIVCGYIRLAGRTVGVVANQAMDMGGSLDINASDKGAKFIRTCDAFNVPILTFQDVPGFLPGTDQEYGGIIRHGAKLIYAYCEATVPKVTVILRKSFGGSHIAMGNRSMRVDYVYAWPSASIAVMGAAGAANICFRKEIKGAEDPQAMRAEKIKEYNDAFLTPYIAAARGYVDDVIEPSETRARVISAFATLEKKHEINPAKKHGNMPL